MRMVSRIVLSFFAVVLVMSSFAGSLGQSPTRAYAETGNGSGLAYDTYNNNDFTNYKHSGIIDSFGLNVWDAGPDNWDMPWSARIAGQVQALYSETYTFYAFADTGDRFRLWVNHELMVDNWSTPSQGEWRSADIDLIAGQKYDIRAELIGDDRASNLQVQWESPTDRDRYGDRASQLFHYSNLEKTPPGNVEDLAATAVNSREMELTFTAPGDEGIQLGGHDYKGWGNASSYDVRYSTSPINDTNWADAKQVSWLTKSLSAGGQERISVPGLEAKTKYYFAVKATGSAGQGAISNLQEAETLELVTDPPAAITDLREVKLGVNYTVYVAWTAPTSWTVPVSGAGTSKAYDIRYSQSPITEANWSNAHIAFGALPAPAQAGTEQFMTVQLQAGASYYIAMKTVDVEGNISPLSNVISVAIPYQQVGKSGKILLRPDMAMNLYSETSPGRMLDEQLLAGDPKSGLAGTPTTMWNTGTGGQFYFAMNEAIIDLQAEYKLEDLYVYGKGSNGKNKIYYGTINNWTLLEDYSEPIGSERWTHYDVNGDNIQTRYLLVTNVSHSPEGGWGGDATMFHEMVLYGTALGELEQEPTPTTYKPTVTMDNFIGVNAFIDDPLEVMLAAGNIREYHNWAWDEGDWSEWGGRADYPGYPNNENGWNPSYGAQGAWDFDEYYKQLKENEVIVTPAIQGGVEWNVNKKEMVTNESDPLLPASYAPYADHMYQFAARYGSTAVDVDKIKVGNGNDPLTGLNTLKYFEGGNEIDGTWLSRDVMYTPFEYAARMSASYDGDQGRMLDANGRSTFGVKQADPNAKFVLPGLADASLNYSLDYIKAVKLWGDKFRDPNGPNGSFPGDVINLHVYTFNDQWKGLSPEEFRLKEKVKEITDYRNQYLPDKEVWVSEFGYDVNAGSPISAQKIINAANEVNYSAEEVQGQWIVRSYLELAAAGVDQAQMYMLRDAGDITDSGQFATSGLVSSKDTGEVPRTSWYYVYTMKNRLNGLYFKEEADSGDPNVKIYKFMDQNDKVKAYVVWSPTSNGTLVNNYSLGLSEQLDDASIVEMLDKDKLGKETRLHLSEDNRVTINVSERPVFILLDNAGEVKAAKVQAAIDAISALPEPEKVMLENKSAIIAARSLVDSAIEAGAVNGEITNLQKLLDCEAKINAEYGYIIEPVGSLIRTAGLKATVKVSPRLGGTLNIGPEVVVFELMDGETPVSIVAVEKDITTAEAITYYFNVLDPSKPSYKVRVFLFNQYDQINNAPISLASPLQLT